MSKRTLVYKTLKCFPSLEAFCFKIYRRFFLPQEALIKNEQGFLELNPALYADTLIRIYKELMPTYHTKTCWQAKACLKKALIKRKNYQTPQAMPQLFLDISAIMEEDFKTGIQRVVQNILSQFVTHPPGNYRVEPVYSNRGAIYRYTSSHRPIDVFPGDIFLGLDLVAKWSNRYWDAFDRIKAYGGKLYFIIYDLLPVQYPQFFSFKLKIVFKTWLKQIATQADGVICISAAVANELSLWLARHPPPRKTALKVGWFHLGAEMDNNRCANILKQSVTSISDLDLIPLIRKSDSILMVGTVEPRKDYATALAVFNHLWGKGEKMNLIIVGKEGWKIDYLNKALKKHPRKGKHLFWFEQASDELLLELYKSCKGLLMMSHCEGFGLPLIEAAHHKLPILTRDIPVFREVAKEYASYFPVDIHFIEMAERIKQWLYEINQTRAIQSDNLPWLSWRESMEQLNQVIIHNYWYTTIQPKKSRPMQLA